MNIVIFMLVYIAVEQAAGLPKECEQPAPFGSKLVQVSFPESDFKLDIELLDICHGLVNGGFKIQSAYDKVDSKIKMSTKWINALQASLTKVNITIERTLGKGSFGIVYQGQSGVYGKVAVKIATNQDDAFYDLQAGRDCSLNPMFFENQCNRRVNELIPFEAANGVLTMGAPGVAKFRAFGLISAHGKLLFYLIIMEHIDSSMTLLSFVQKCFKKFNHHQRMNYIVDTQRKLNDINKNLILKHHIFHNDIKSDNILVRVRGTNETTRNRCGNGRADLDLYMIDFGNSIVNVNRKSPQGHTIMAQEQFRFKRYFLIYRAPEVTCQNALIKMAPLMTWYLGVIAFEMCSHGAKDFILAPSMQVCTLLRINFMPNANSFDLFIKPYPSAESSFKLCFNKSMAAYLQTALHYDPNTRVPSDYLIKNVKLHD